LIQDRELREQVEAEVSCYMAGVRV